MLIVIMGLKHSFHLVALKEELPKAGGSRLLAGGNCGGNLFNRMERIKCENKGHYVVWFSIFRTTNE
jgi:hypothetical protein